MAETEKNRLKRWIYETNDPDLLANYYDQTYTELTESEQSRLMKRLNSAFALDTMVSRIEAQRDELLIDVPVFGVKRNGSRTELVGVVPDEEEDYTDDLLAAGWHQLFRSRGVDFTTEELAQFSEEYYPKCVMSELVHRVIPRTHVESVKLPPYDAASQEERGELDRTEYEEHRAEKVRETVLEAVQKWRSPVILTLGNETMTVIGVEDTDVLCMEEAFAGIESTTVNVDLEARMSDGTGFMDSVSMLYMTERAAAG
ncbi:MAG: hypothetical protein K6G16_11320 [Lachnospiraceae bacterium]|nr:hypothetical protein [Lachnospiraceae bacterium]